MGDIVFWTIIRAAVFITVALFSKPYFDYQVWWPIVFFSLYAIVIHPAIIKYQQFKESNKPIFTSTLCSTCRHFEKTAVLCTKLDEHPTEQYLPCEGLNWEPKPDEIIVPEDK